MAVSIAAAVARMKQDVRGGHRPRRGRGGVRDELGYHDWRDRILDPATTVAPFVKQVLHGNCPCAEVRHLDPAAARRSFTPAAYCQARARLPLAVYQSLLTRVADAALPATREPRQPWGGVHRVFLIDGTTFSMPDTPELQRAFGQPAGHAPGCGFPAAHCCC
jgi:hypothetical protein